jgi:hypothetical protein
MFYFSRDFMNWLLRAPVIQTVFSELAPSTVPGFSTGSAGFEFVARLFWTIRKRFLRSTTIVTLPIAGTYIDAFSLTSGPKFCSVVSLPLLLKLVCMPDQIRASHLFAREIDADGSLPQQVGRKSILLTRDTTYHHVTKWQTVM